VLISGQAFEHIEFFWLTMLEIARVLKPGGICCLIAPSGGFEHKYPVDCWRFYPDGFLALSRFAGFTTLECFYRTESSDYSDDSNLWQDTVLVAQKPAEKIGNKLRRRLLQWMTGLFANVS
jgi:SAM-dependent methyltransferase